MNLDSLNVEQKFARALLDLRKLRPFYAAIYENIDKIERESIGTAAVDIKNMYYNYDYMDKLPYSEFLFVILHELTHIALLHVARTEDKDRLAWNYCTDFIVNYILIKEFKLDDTKKYAVNGIKVPKGALVMDLTDDDTAESLYTAFMRKSEDEQKECYSQYLLGAGGSASGSKQTDHSTENSGGTNEEQNNMNSHNNDEDSGTDAFNESGISSDGNQGNKGSGDEKSTDNRDESNSGDLNDTRENEDGNDNGGSSDEKQREGQKYTFSDLIDSKSISDALDIEKVKGLLAIAAVREKMEGQYGTSGSMLYRLTEELLKSKNDWIKMLRKHCIRLASSDTSFASPDKRMYYQQAIYPGSYVDESKLLNGVALCIDTSGSMTSEDIAYVLGQIDDICKGYKVNYETFCWDTKMVKVCDGQSVNDITNEGLAGGGGTMPNCIFEYFNGVKKKPNVIIIFTDAEFFTKPFEGESGRKLGKKYKNVIWVMTRQYNTRFKPTIGKIAFAKFPD